MRWQIRTLTAVSRSGGRDEGDIFSLVNRHGGRGQQPDGTGDRPGLHRPHLAAAAPGAAPHPAGAPGGAARQDQADVAATPAATAAVLPARPGAAGGRAARSGRDLAAQGLGQPATDRDAGPALDPAVPAARAVCPARLPARPEPSHPFVAGYAPARHLPGSETGGQHPGGHPDDRPAARQVTAVPVQRSGGHDRGADVGVQGPHPRPGGGDPALGQPHAERR
ncbi:hypothetical protein D3C79_696620 [compost metagenome]